MRDTGAGSEDSKVLVGSVSGVENDCCLNLIVLSLWISVDVSMSNEVDEIFSNEPCLGKEERLEV